MIRQERQQAIIDILKNLRGLEPLKQLFWSELNYQRVYKVTEVLSWWREPAEWWNGKSVRLCFRVDAKNTSIGTIEISRLGESWFLDRVYD
ncbi:unnamed protein product [marine sediment metagenome]|uniref:Uncharacterized protein n=1 Tax=marine sediment metagenome TaxID=412755 RepID=X1UZC1_9ZZZZ